MKKEEKKILMAGISPGYGGTEAVIYSILPFLIHEGYKVDFINTYDKPLARQDWLSSLGCEIVDLCLRRKGRFFKYKKEIRSFFHKNQGHYYVIWVNYQYLDELDLFKYGMRGGAKKRIAVAHNSGAAGKRSKIGRFISKLNQIRIKRYATDLIGVSSLAAAFCYGSRNKAKIITSGIDAQRFRFSKGARGDLRQQLEIPANALIYGSSGRLHPDKNQLFLIDMFSKLAADNPNCYFLLAGKGDYEKEIRGKIGSYNLTDRFILITDMDDLSSFYSAIDIFVFSSLAEGLGMVLIEAQCSGLPCFCSDKMIPREAEVLDSFCWLSLELGAEGWAKQISECPLNDFLDRGNSYKLIESKGLGKRDFAKKYLEVLGDGE